MNQRVAVVGHLCLDIIPTLPSLTSIEPGRLIEVGPAAVSLGGAVANVGLALHRLGVPVRLIGKTGSDPFGHLARRILEDRDRSLGGSLIVSPQEATSYSLVISPPGRDRTFLHYPGCNATFVAGDVPDDGFAGVSHVHFGYPPLMGAMVADEGAELQGLFLRAKASGCTTSLDMSLPDPSTETGRAAWDRILDNVLPYVDFFLPSLDELAYMLPKEPPTAEALADACLRRGAGVVVVKQGDAGLVARTGSAARVCEIPNLTDPSRWSDQRAEQACFPTSVVGTTGSGDATIAGFLMGLVRGFSLSACLAAGCAVGACCVEAPDATSGVRTWEETEFRLREEWNAI